MLVRECPTDVWTVDGCIASVPCPRLIDANGVSLGSHELQLHAFLLALPDSVVSADFTLSATVTRISASANQGSVKLAFGKLKDNETATVTVDGANVLAAVALDAAGRPSSSNPSGVTFSNEGIVVSKNINVLFSFSNITDGDTTSSKGSVTTP